MITILLVLAAVIGIGTYAYVANRLHGASLRDSLDDLGHWVGNLVGRS